jgi:hypothetical protein
MRVARSVLPWLAPDALKAASSMRTKRIARRESQTHGGETTLTNVKVDLFARLSRDKTRNLCLAKVWSSRNFQHDH